jgi:hypothetical protein
MGGYPASYQAGCSPENPPSYWERYPDSNSASPSADCPDHRPESNPETHLENNTADNLPDNPENHLVDSSPDCSASYVPSTSRCLTKLRIKVSSPQPKEDLCRVRSVV